ncbi:MAG: ATP-binding protein [Clostridiales bacterium]|nr:ATP-binding protein [Clostridiales bacterium]
MEAINITAAKGLEMLRAALTATSPSDPALAERKKAEMINSTPDRLNEQDGYDCPLCMNRGYFQEVDDSTGNLYTPVRPCKCMKVREILARIRQSGHVHALKTRTFESFDAKEDWQKQMLATAKGYAEGWNGKNWLLLCGQPGCGKTHLCTAVCGELLKRGVAVEFALLRDEMTRLKRAMTEEGDAFERQLKRLRECEALYLDDLFKPVKGTEPSPADVKLTFDIINHRYENELPTILSGELSLNQMLELDEAASSRIAEMARAHRLYIGSAPGRNKRLE